MRGARRGACERWCDRDAALPLLSMSESECKGNETIRAVTNG